MDSFSLELHAAHLVMIYEDANGTGTQDRTKRARPAVAISAACNHCMGAQLKADAIKCNSYIVNWRYSLRFLNRLPLAANSLLIEWIEPPFCPRQCGIRLRCEFYVLFMLCKRGPIIVKISKQIVKIDRCRLSLSFGAPWCWLTHTYTRVRIHTAIQIEIHRMPSTASFVEFRTPFWGARTPRLGLAILPRRVSIEFLSPSRAYLYIESSYTYMYVMWVSVCVCACAHNHCGSQKELINLVT